MQNQTKVFRNQQGFSHLLKGSGGDTARANDLQVSKASTPEPAVQFAPEFVLHPVSGSGRGTQGQYTVHRGRYKYKMSNDIGLDGSEGLEAPGAVDAVDFGWDDDAPSSGKVSGRRKKAQKKAKVGTFEAMDLSPLVLKGIRRKGFRLPTPIQRKTIPLIMQGLDIVGMARTGSGKTAAFVIPLLEKLKGHSTAGARALILSPTRELALQTFKVVQDLGRSMDLRTAVLVGGDAIEAQFGELAAGPDLIVATPGRLVHMLTEIDAFSLRGVEIAVFDEADRLFEMGFADEINQILGGMSGSRQTLLFSATMPRILAEFARAGLKDPELIRLDADSKISPDLKMHFFRVRDEEKIAALLFLLREVIEAGQSTILFASTRHHVEYLALLLAKERISAVAVHGHLDQSARKINLAKFKAGKAEVLVVTDVAARGLDIPLLDNVINFDFPPKPKLFVHRSGRVARAGRSGTSYNFVTGEELGYLVDLHLFLGRKLIPSPVRDLSKAAADLEKIYASFDHANPPPSELGRFPQMVLDPLMGRVIELINDTPDLAIQQKSLSNAKALYIKTRPPASSESARRAKSLDREGIHPVLAAAVPSLALGGLEAQESLADITAALRAYRPSQTVFEAQVASARAGQGAGMAATPGMLAAGAHERNVEVMKIKREAHKDAIESKKRHAKYEQEEGTREGKSSALAEVEAVMNEASSVGRSNRFRDASFYLSHEPAAGGRTAEQFLAVGSGDQFRDAVMDLGAEDAEGAAQRKSSAWQWDNKAKRYVKLQQGEVMKGGRRVKTNVKQGSTKKSKENAGELYKKWSKKTKMVVGGAGNTNADLSGRFKRGGRGWVNPLKPQDDDDHGPPRDGRKPRDELKTMDEVRKSRKEEAKKRERNLPKKEREFRARQEKMKASGGVNKGGKGGFGGVPKKGKGNASGRGGRGGKAGGRGRG